MKRLLATVLALAMLLTLGTAFADGITEENGIKTVLNQVSGKVIQVATADADLSAPIAPEDNPWASFDTSEPVSLVFYVVGSDGEDHQKVIDLANQRMKQLINTTIEVCDDGERALSVIRTFKPDILVTDIRMPGLDGIKLAEEYLYHNPEAKVIFISGYSDVPYLRSAIRLRAVSYVEKPIDIEELSADIRTAVEEISNRYQVSLDREELRAKSLFAQQTSPACIRMKPKHPWSWRIYRNHTARFPSQ